MYNAIVARIKTRPHPNADRLLLGEVLGAQVVTSLDTPDGALGVYFPIDGVLSVEFADKNNLLNASARAALQLPPSDKVGFFDHHRRVRAQKFRGEKSEGIWLPMDCLGQQYEVPLFVEGYLFDSVNGQTICEKWVSKKNVGPTGSLARKAKRGELVGFPKHVETDQWRFYKDEIPNGSLLTITEKLHGTSHRVGLVLDDQKKWYQFWKPRYRRFDGSRNVVLSDHTGRQSFYGSDQFRYDTTPYIGRKGEVLFGEIVGWVGDKPIMPSQAIPKKDLPEEYAKYGSKMNYFYACEPGQATFYVYRIVQFNEDGDGVELSHAQVEKRAKALGYPTPQQLATPLIYTPEAADTINALVEYSTVGSSVEDSRQIREGVVIRVDQPDGHTRYLKNKSFAFKLLEGIIKSDEQYEDVEENA